MADDHFIAGQKQATSVEQRLLASGVDRRLQAGERSGRAMWGNQPCFGLGQTQPDAKPLSTSEGDTTRSPSKANGVRSIAGLLRAFRGRRDHDFC